MISMLAYASVAILLGWSTYVVTGLFASGSVALVAGWLNMAICLILLRDNIVLQSLVAVLGPIGIVLPALALRHMAIGSGLELPAFGALELVIFLVIYMAFLVTSTGVIPADLYRIGYAPIPVGIMVLVLCAYGALTGNFFVPLVAVLGQGLWVMGWGSSNWFDHVTHALLVPVVFVVLIHRLL